MSQDESTSRVIAMRAELAALELTEATRIMEALRTVRRQVAHRCAEIAAPKAGKPSNCRTCALLIRDAIRNEFGLSTPESEYPAEVTK